MIIIIIIIIIINGVVLIMMEVEVVVCNILTTSDTEHFNELESELMTL